MRAQAKIKALSRQWLTVIMFLTVLVRNFSKSPSVMEGLFAVSRPVVELPGVEPGSPGDSPGEVAND